MRLSRFSGLLFLAVCFSLAAENSNVAKAQASSRPDLIEKSWVLTTWTDDGRAAIANIKDVTRMPGGNLRVVSVSYHPSYNADNKIRGAYLMSRDEVDCALKSIAIREAQLYSLRDIPIGGRTEYYDALSQPFPETAGWKRVENICRLAELGPNRWDTTFASVSDFIRVAERNYPPQGPAPKKAVPKSKQKPR